MGFITDLNGHSVAIPEPSWLLIPKGFKPLAGGRAAHHRLRIRRVSILYRARGGELTVF